MPRSVRHTIWQYDIFMSYNRKSDELEPFAIKLRKRIEDTFRELTGFDARIFLDTSEISTAMLWERRIDSALNASAVLIAIETPSYYTSEWCTRELETFLALEEQRRAYYQLLPYESLIFPVRRISLDNLIHEPSRQRSYIKRMRERQAVNLINILPESSDFLARVDNLVIGIVSVLQKMMQPDFHSIPLRSDRDEPHAGLVLSTPLVTTYTGTDPQKLVRLLVEAEGVTLIDVLHEGLSELLEIAILERRRKYPPDQRFWDQLHIVFLSQDLLAHVGDGLSIEFPDKPRALQERIHRHNWSRRRLMSLLLRHGVPGRWTLSSYPNVLPFVGALFAMPDGRRVVQLRVTRPSRQENDHLSVEFIDRVDQFFEAAFRELVESSMEDHEVVLVGTPGEGPNTFLCRGARYRRSVLTEGRNVADWLVAIVAITWRMGRSGPEPLLQANTPRNSTREIGKASHVSGYVNYRDYAATLTDQHSNVYTECPLPELAIFNALNRELHDDFDLAVPAGSSVLVGSANFYYPDKENIYFYILSQEIDPTHRFDTDTQMFAWTMDELLTIRRHQVFRNALKVFSFELTKRQRMKACDLVILNLLTQGNYDLAHDIRQAALAEDLSTELTKRLDHEIESTRIYKYDLARELELDGLAGLQYRAFYSILLPVYAQLGIRGASEHLGSIAEDPARASARDELTAHYNDEELITSLPIEV